MDVDGEEEDEEEGEGEREECKVGKQLNSLRTFSFHF